jgi:D-arabinose 1-dehydrogenase-like Zn-dependent alcohol dehydrogenase
MDLPTPGFGGALVRLETSGVCHTDLHGAQGDWPVRTTQPFIPGHEGYGTVVVLGEGVTDLKVGNASTTLDEVNDVFDRMRRGNIDGRVVIDYRRS